MLITTKLAGSAHRIHTLNNKPLFGDIFIFKRPNSRVNVLPKYILEFWKTRFGFCGRRNLEKSCGKGSSIRGLQVEYMKRICHVSCVHIHVEVHGTHVQCMYNV